MWVEPTEAKKNEIEWLIYILREYGRIVNTAAKHLNLRVALSQHSGIPDSWDCQVGDLCVLHKSSGTPTPENFKTQPQALKTMEKSWGTREPIRFSMEYSPTLGSIWVEMSVHVPYM